jgi:thioesterase domain-containing protein
MVRLILQEQVEGPFVLAGYCFGGIVAFETARRLASHHQVRVVLFDAPLPGHPAFGNYFRNWVGKGRRKQGTTIDSGHLKSNGAGSSEDANGLLFSSPDIHPLRGRIRRSMWHVVSRTRPLIRLFESARPVQSRLMKYEEGYFPFYLARPIDAPILHFHCMDESDDVQVMSRVAWRKFAQQGVDERSIPGDHMHLLHESNLQQIVDELLKWIGPGLAQAGSQKQL